LCASFPHSRGRIRPGARSQRGYKLAAAEGTRKVGRPREPQVLWGHLLRGCHQRAVEKREHRAESLVGRDGWPDPDGCDGRRGGPAVVEERERLQKGRHVSPVFDRRERNPQIQPRQVASVSIVECPHFIRDALETNGTGQRRDGKCELAHPWNMWHNRRVLRRIIGNPADVLARWFLHRHLHRPKVQDTSRRMGLAGQVKQTHFGHFACNATGGE